MPTRPEQRKKLKGKATLSRATGGESFIHLTVEDASNHNRLIEIHISPENFALMLTGLAGTNCDIITIADKEAIEALGKKLITKRVTCKRCYGVVSFTHKDQRDIVKSHFQFNYAPKGWKLFSDGTNSQQRGEKHEYIIYRYEEE